MSKNNYPMEAKGDDIPAALQLANTYNNRKNPYNGAGRKVSNKRVNKFIKVDKKDDDEVVKVEATKIEKKAEMDPATKKMLLYGLGGAAGGYGLGTIMDWIRGKTDDSRTNLPLLMALIGGGGAMYAKDKGYLGELSSMLAPGGVSKDEDTPADEEGGSGSEGSSPTYLNDEEFKQYLSVMGNAIRDKSPEEITELLNIPQISGEELKAKLDLDNTINTGRNVAAGLLIADDVHDFGSAAYNLAKSEKAPKVLGRAADRLAGKIPTGVKGLYETLSKSLVGKLGKGAVRHGFKAVFAALETINSISDVKDKAAYANRLLKDLDANSAGFTPQQLTQLKSKVHNAVYDKETDFKEGYKHDEGLADIYNMNHMRGIALKRLKNLRNKYKDKDAFVKTTEEEYDTALKDYLASTGTTEQDFTPQQLEDIKSRIRSTGHRLSGDRPMYIPRVDLDYDTAVKQFIDQDAKALQTKYLNSNAGGGGMLNRFVRLPMLSVTGVTDAVTPFKDIYNEYERAANAPTSKGFWNRFSTGAGNVYDKTIRRVNAVDNRIEKATGPKMKALAIADGITTTPWYTIPGMVNRSYNYYKDLIW